MSDLLESYEGHNGCEFEKKLSLLESEIKISQDNRETTIRKESNLFDYDNAELLENYDNRSISFINDFDDYGCSSSERSNANTEENSN